MKKAVKICSQYLFVFFLLVPASLFGQTVTVYEETFDSPWNTGDWDQYTPEGGAWATQLAPFICQGDQAVSHWDNGEPVNGWIISDLISLQAGITYTCSFQQRVGNSSFPENMGTYIYQGNEADFTPGTATAVIWQADNLTNETCSSRSNTFTVPSDGNYNIVFHCTSAADEFYAIWDYIKITRPTTTQAPTVTTQAVTGITITTATGNGNITDLGTPNPTAHGVAWNTAGTPTLADNNTDEGAAGATGAFTGNITGLSPNTTYYVRAYATNTADTVYGDVVSFITIDTDGIPTVEESGPDGTDPSYDGNNDGIPDNNQPNVGSFHTADGNDYVTLAAPDGTRFSGVQALPAPAPGTFPDPVSFPCGLFRFTVNGIAPGGSVQVELILPAGASCNSYWKYGREPGNATVHPYWFNLAGGTGAQIMGNTVVLTFIDGQRGDDDLNSANGIIVDDGGPGSTAAVIPALTRGGMILFMVLISALACWMIRRRRHP